jgi:hypothetical protein
MKVVIVGERRTHFGQDFVFVKHRTSSRVQTADVGWWCLALDVDVGASSSSAGSWSLHDVKLHLMNIYDQ